MNETELLFSEILNCDRMSLYQNKDLSLDRDKSLLIASALKRRMAGEPIQYILGKADFMGFEFKVNSDVFIPRPETEILVETAVGLVHSQKSMVHSILDIGTGSGCIAVSLAKLITNASITAVDISEKAIEVAKQNALLNNVKINFLVSNLFSNNKLRTISAKNIGGSPPQYLAGSPIFMESAKICGGNFDLIVSNPPYISVAEIESLQPEVRSEPRIALGGGSDGLDFYRRIISSASLYLKASGFLIMETGFNQRKKIENIFQKSGNFEIIEFIKDYNNLDRVIVARKIRKNG